MIKLTGSEFKALHSMQVNNTCRNDSPIAFRYVGMREINGGVECIAGDGHKATRLFLRGSLSREVAVIIPRIDVKSDDEVKIAIVKSRLEFRTNSFIYSSEIQDVGYPFNTIEYTGISRDTRYMVGYSKARLSIDILKKQLTIARKAGCLSIDIITENQHEGNFTDQPVIIKPTSSINDIDIVQVIMPIEVHKS